MSALRKKMHPDSLNTLLFLKANRHLWSNASIIHKILNDMKNKNIDDNDIETDIAEDEDDSDIDEFNH
jgi:hypothetical protein